MFLFILWYYHIRNQEKIQDTLASSGDYIIVLLFLFDLPEILILTIFLHKALLKYSGKGD